jgi:predicted peptidase
MAALFPVDRDRIFVVGHSMGAAQALAATRTEPEKLAGVAALGGGGRVRVTDVIRKLPFFVGAGEKDFGLRGARALRRSLDRGRVKTVRYREYANVEHLGIVQVALDEVFAFFDEIAEQ